jgi:hypothetical protein
MVYVNKLRHIDIVIYLFYFILFLADQGQLILYSERPNGRRSFVVESINLDSPERSFLVLRSYHLLHWMSKVKNTEGNHPTDIACYVNKFMEEYPCLVSGNGTQVCSLIFSSDRLNPSSSDSPFTYQTSSCVHSNVQGRTRTDKCRETVY